MALSRLLLPSNTRKTELPSAVLTRVFLARLGARTAPFALWSWIGLTCTAQETARIQVEVNLVNVAASVRDAQGRLVNDLTKDDFEILEEGTAQRIQLFARNLDLPLTLGIVLDFSGSQGEYMKKHRRDLEVFLENVLGPRDQAFVVCFGNRLFLVSDLSNSPAQIQESLKRFEKGDRGFARIDPDMIRTGGTAFYDAIYHGSQKLADVAGRKALVVFSDGEDNASAHHMIDAIEAAQSAGTLVYGLRYTHMEGNRQTARNIYGTRVMERLSRDTGGTDFDADRMNLKAAFRQINEELRTLYELAFASTNPVRDGSFRKLQVRVKRSGLVVRTKSGYYAK